MSRNYYINASGRLSRHDNTIYLETKKDGETVKKPILTQKSLIEPMWN